MCQERLRSAHAWIKKTVDNQKHRIAARVGRIKLGVQGRDVFFMPLAVPDAACHAGAAARAKVFAQRVFISAQPQGGTGQLDGADEQARLCRGV